MDCKSCPWPITTRGFSRRTWLNPSIDQSALGRLVWATNLNTSSCWSSTMPQSIRKSSLPGSENRLVVWSLMSTLWLVAFFIWFQSFGFPNNPDLTRSLVWSSIPLNTLDLIDPPVVTSAAPWSWLNLLQRIPFIVTAIVIWLGAWAMGSLVLRLCRVELIDFERIFFSLCLGLSLVSLVTLLLGLCGRLDRGALLAILIGVLVVEIALQIRLHRIPSLVGLSSTARWIPACWSSRLVLMAMVPFVVGQLLGAMTPQTDFDVVEYHLGGPKEWFLQGSISRLPHNIYTNFPFLTEMLILAGMVVFGDWRWGALAGQAVIAGFAPLTALGLYAAGRHWFSPAAGRMAALVYLTSPWTYRISIIAYAEGGLACYLFAAFFAVLLIRERLLASNTFPVSVPVGLVFLSGALGGSAMACKYTGLVSVAVPVFAMLIWVLFQNLLRLRSDSQTRWLRAGLLQASAVAIIFVTGLALTVGPWLLKNVIATGNPVYPLAYRVFGGIDRDEELDQQWRQAHAARAYTSWSERLLDLPVKVSDVMANNDWHSPLMFGLAPLSLWCTRRSPGQPGKRKGEVGIQSFQASRVIVLLWLYVVWQFGTWWLLTHHIDRFYVPMFSVVAFLAGVGMNWPTLTDTSWRKSLWPTVWKLTASIFLIASVLYNTQIMLYIGGFNAGRLDLKVAEQIAISPRIQWLNEKYESGQLSPLTNVLCVGEAGLFHARYPYLYNTVFDRSLFEEICAAPGTSPRTLRPVGEIREQFRRLRITHIDVNWAEIERYRAPGSYGYSEFVQPKRFEELKQLGLLAPSLFTTRQEKTEQITSEIFPVLPE